MILNYPAIWRHEISQFHIVLKHILFQFDSHHNSNVSDMFIKTSFFYGKCQNDPYQRKMPSFKTIFLLNYKLSGRLVVQSQ